MINTIFTNIKVSPLLQVILLIALIILIGLIAYLIIIKFVGSKNRFLALSKIASSRIYYINLQTNRATYFDKMNPSKQKVVPLDAFLSQYTQEDYYRVSNWLRNLINPKKETPWHIEASLVIKKTKKTSFSVIEVFHVNYEQKTVNLNSYLLQYLKHDKKGALGRKSQMILFDQAKRLIKKSPSHRGATYAIRFFYRKYQGNLNSSVSAVFFKKVKDKIGKYLSPSLFLIESEDNDILLIDIKTINVEEHLRTAHSIGQAISKYFEVSGLKDDVHYAIGIVENKNFPHDFLSLSENAREMAIYAENQHQTLAFFDKSRLQSNELNHLQRAVDVIIKDKKFDVLYRPIINYPALQLIGYQAKDIIYLEDGSVSNLEILYLGNNQNEQYRELLSLITRNMLLTFNEHKPSDDCLLFYPFSIYERQFIHKNLPLMKKARETKLVIMLDKQEIDNFDGDTEALMHLISGFKEKGWQIALTFNDGHLFSELDLYTLFDYFILDHRMIKTVLSDDRVRINIHSLIDSLVPLNKPILMFDVCDLPSIEVMVNFHIDGLSATCLAPFMNQLTNVDDKMLSKLRKMES